MAFVAFLDADVLYRSTLRDVLLSLAEAGICQVRWSPDVLDEVERNLARRTKAPSPRVAEEGARYLRQTVEIAFPDAIVTSNVAHFPEQVCATLGIEVQDPDTFLVYQFGLVPEQLLRSLRELSAERHSPMDTPEGILSALGQATPRFCAMALERLGGRRDNT